MKMRKSISIVTSKNKSFSNSENKLKDQKTPTNIGSKYNNQNILNIS